MDEKPSGGRCGVWRDFEPGSVNVLDMAERIDGLELSAIGFGARTRVSERKQRFMVLSLRPINVDRNLELNFFTTSQS